MSKNIKLSKRLSFAASFVKPGSRVLDVGTDHAYVPIWLLENEIAEFAAGSDVNAGPLKSAEQNSKKFKTDGKLALYLSDGLANAECEKNCYDCILICGMGGELIADIIDSSAYVRNSGAMLILQPMTMQDVLRGYLVENGFKITDESILRDCGKFYQFIVCSFTGENTELTPCERLVGAINIENGKNNPDFLPYIKKQCGILQNKLNGMSIAGKTGETDSLLLEELEKLIRTE